MYNVFGFVNTLFIFISLIGVFSQLQKIRHRKHSGSVGRASALISLNQFCMSFLAYLAFFVYGYSIVPFNHYIVWPRLAASTLVLWILFEIWHDRKDPHSSGVLISATVIFTCGLIGLSFGHSYLDQSKHISTGLILIVTVLLAQGYGHQIKIILNAGDTGAVDIKMSQFILLMDISTIAFALSIGWADGWPLFTLAVVSASTKLIIMYLFRWVRVSNRAKLRRQAWELT